MEFTDYKLYHAAPGTNRVVDHGTIRTIIIPSAFSTLGTNVRPDVQQNPGGLRRLRALEARPGLGGQDGGDVQGYTYDLFTNPNPGGANEGNGWYFNYSADHPYIKHIITLCPTDDPTDRILTQKAVGSYRIHQNSVLRATDLHYKVNSTSEVLTYNTTIDWATETSPQIIETGKPRTGIEVDWDLSENRVPYCTWVTITTEFVLPYGNYIAYDDVYFTYPDIVFRFPYLIWEIRTPEIDNVEKIPNVCGGYVIGAFDLIDPKAADGPEVIAEYRLIHE